MGAPAYGDSKLANILHAFELHRRYAAKGLTAAALNPGEIMTGILKPETGWFPWLLQCAGSGIERVVSITKTVEAGAATQVYAAVRAPLRQQAAFFEDCNERELYTSSLENFVRDEVNGKLFWAHSEALVKGALKAQVAGA